MKGTFPLRRSLLLVLNLYSCTACSISRYGVSAQTIVVRFEIHVLVWLGMCTLLIYDSCVVCVCVCALSLVISEGSEGNLLGARK